MEVALAVVVVAAVLAAWPAFYLASGAAVFVAADSFLLWIATSGQVVSV